MIISYFNNNITAHVNVVRILSPCYVPVALYKTSHREILSENSIAHFACNPRVSARNCHVSNRGGEGGGERKATRADSINRLVLILIIAASHVTAGGGSLPCGDITLEIRAQMDGQIADLEW